MIYLLLSLLLSVAFAQDCKNQISLNNLKVYQESGAFRGACDDSSQCLCFDGIDLDIQDLSEIQKPVWEPKSNVVPCADQASCESEIAKPSFCPSEYQAFWAPIEDRFEAYCTKIIRMENTGQFELKENSDKKLAKDARLKTEADKKAKQKEADDLLKKSGTLTTAEITKILKAKFGGE